MAGCALPPLEQVLGRDVHEFISALINLWDYIRYRTKFISDTYKADEEELIFGDGRKFSYGYRAQLFTLAEAYYADHMRRVRIVKLNDFYNELVDTIRSRAHYLWPNSFYINCRSIYDAAREQGVTEHDLLIKVNKAARVTRYFSALKLWKDCTSPVPPFLWLEEHHFDRDCSSADTNNSRHDSDKDSTVAQASHDSDD